MKEKFKAYLEVQFRQIAPTKAAMEYRKQMLVEMLDRAQELRIKGMTDDDLICGMVIAELGDFSAKLREFENNTVKKEISRKLALVCTSISAAYIVALTLVYLIVGFVTHKWHPCWLIIVGGVLGGLIVVFSFLAARFAKRKLYLPMRTVIAMIEILLCTLIFLILQIACRIGGGWMTFLAMVALIACSDTALSFATGGKLKWLQLPVCFEIVCVMLYVILGMTVSGFWHPGWLMCLGGVVFAIIEATVCGAVFASRKNKQNTQEKTVVDDSYWTEW